ncbi:MAG: hypothetical protein VCC00_04015 [Deltaproteobacteria bacterium]
MSENAHEETKTWAPLEEAVAQMKEFDEKARQIVRDTAEEVRTRSEKAIDDAREQTEKTLKLVRKNIDNARGSIEERTGEWPEWTKLPEFFEKQLESLQKEFLVTVEKLAKSLRLSTDKELDALKRKVSALEKKVNDLTSQKAA